MDVCELLTQIFGIFDDAFATMNFLKQTNKQLRTINICYTVDDDQPMCTIQQQPTNQKHVPFQTVLYTLMDALFGSAPINFLYRFCSAVPLAHNRRK